MNHYYDRCDISVCCVVVGGSSPSGAACTHPNQYRQREGGVTNFPSHFGLTVECSSLLHCVATALQEIDRRAARRNTEDVKDCLRRRSRCVHHTGGIRDTAQGYSERLS